LRLAIYLPLLLARLSMRKALIAGFLFSIYCAAVTLQQLSIDEMAQQSTAIVRVHVLASTASFTGSTIYTHYKLQLDETLKGFPTSEVMVPGGVSGRYRQTFPGVPQLEVGKEYLLFLWTSSTGITHLMGLSQGVFDLSTASDGSIVASRGSIGELMLDKSGRPVRDLGLTLRMSDIRARAGAPQSGGGKIR